jgi:hypothetical protein
MIQTVISVDILFRCYISTILKEQTRENVRSKDTADIMGAMNWSV